jgi:hypothetical protein
MMWNLKKHPIHTFKWSSFEINYVFPIHPVAAKEEAFQKYININGSFYPAFSGGSKSLF